MYAGVGWGGWFGGRPLGKYFLRVSWNRRLDHDVYTGYLVYTDVPRRQLSGNFCLTSFTEQEGIDEIFVHHPECYREISAIEEFMRWAKDQSSSALSLERSTAQEKKRIVARVGNHVVIHN